VLDGFAMVMHCRAASSRHRSTRQRAAAHPIGKDLEERDDGVFVIAHKMPRDWGISVVDPETRHGHKSAAHSFDGDTDHAAIDPDTEIITATTVLPGDVSDAAPPEVPLADLLEDGEEAATPTETGEEDRPVADGDDAYGTGELHELPTRPASRSA
jgi:hypothetical protein